MMELSEPNNGVESMLRYDSRSEGWAGRLLRYFPAIIFATLATSFFATIFQAENNLWRLSQLSVELDFATHVRTIAHDLRNFFPFFFLIASVAMACSLPVARLLWAFDPYWQLPIAMAAGTTGLLVAFAVADIASPLPTLFAATREIPARASMAATGAVGGLIFALTLRLAPVGATTGGKRMAAAAGLSVVIVVALFLTTTPPARLQTTRHTGYSAEVVADGLAHPWGLAFLSDGRALVTERAGRLRMLSASGNLLPEAISGLPENLLVGGQGGLMDVAVRAETTPPQIFLTYACGTQLRNNTCLGRALLKAMRLEDFKVLLSASPKQEADSQYGSRIVFLPDGSLLMTIGDGMDFRESAQSLTSHYGKIVRLWPNGHIPDDNPFHDQPGKLAEIYSFGHRNPQGLVYDPKRDRVFSHEHGPKGGDELNEIVPGGDYAWPTATHGVNYPGDYVSPFEYRQGTVAPLRVWTPSIAPSGLAVYYGDKFPEWEGNLLVGSLAGEAMLRLALEGDEIVREEVMFQDLGKRIRSIVVSPTDDIYFLTDHHPGQVMRVARGSRDRRAPGP